MHNKKWAIALSDRRESNGFTFIEILVVVTIIGVLTAGAAVSFSQFSAQSRDAKRKADLEQVRAALEMYKSNNNVYPATLVFGCPSTIGLSDPNPGTTIYINKLPNDPKCTTNPNYTYESENSNQSYSLTATLDDGVTTYSLNPYGQK